MFAAFYSDPHLGHANIIKYCSRPFENVDDMNDALVANYNHLIGAGDTVLWVGDCFFKGNSEKYQHILGKMNGRKLLIVGNHDQGDGAMSRMGFDLVMKEAVININGITCRVSHYPYDGPQGMADKHAIRRPIKHSGEILLHGHNHSKSKITGPRSINIGVDAWDFCPALYGDVAKLVSGLELCT